MNTPSDARGRTLWWMLAGACLLSAFVRPVQEQIDRRTMGPKTDPDVLYFGSAKAVKVLAFGYDSLLADIYWMRTIQYYGRREEANRRLVRYKNLATFLEITTMLDPDLLDAYRAGSSLLAEPDPLGAGQPEEAIRLLDRGISSHPSDWRLYFDKGFVYYWQFKDFAQAGRVWLAASRMAGAPYWMEGLAAMAMSKGGAVETARALWIRQYESSSRPEMRENARNYLASLQIDEDRWTIEFFIEKFRRKTGRLPAGFDDLIRAGYLTSIPRDPSGVPYSYDETQGTVHVNPKSKVRYLQIPYDYREAFLEKLTRAFGPM